MPVRTTARAIIDAPAAFAWEVLSDYTNDPLWRGGVSRMDQQSPGPVHEGATAVEDLRVLGRRTVTTVRIEEVRPGAEFAWRAIAGSAARGTRTIHALPNGRCELVTAREITLGGVDLLAQPLVSWVLARAERRDVLAAARLVEARHAAVKQTDARAAG